MMTAHDSVMMVATRTDAKARDTGEPVNVQARKRSRSMPDCTARARASQSLPVALSSCSHRLLEGITSNVAPSVAGGVRYCTCSL